MKCLKNLEERTRISGGTRMVDVIHHKKLQCLYRALEASDQSVHMELVKRIRIFNKDKKENEYTEATIDFDCTMNAYKLTEDNDIKVITCDFGYNLNTGDILHDLNNDIYYLVYLRNFEENAYFKGQVKLCKFDLEFENNVKTRACVRGAVETTTKWIEKKNIEINELNSSLQLWIPASNVTLDCLDRFDKVKVNGDTYEIVARDLLSISGVYQIALKEYYNDITEQEPEKPSEELPKQEEETIAPTINGNEEVYGYDENIKYSISNLNDGIWSVSNPKIVEFVVNNSKYCQINILTGKNNSFIIKYTSKDGISVAKTIKINSL